MTISSVYDPSLTPTVRAINSRSRLIREQSFWEVELHVIFCPFQTLLYMCFLSMEASTQVQLIS